LIGTAGALGLAVFALALPALAQPAGAASPVGSGVVVLHSAEAIEGRIRETADGYCITVPDGEIRLRKAEVEFCCGSLREAYARLRAVIADDANEHLRLAQWCVRQGLLDLAAQEVAAARAINPSHPMVEAIQRRLEISKELAENPSAASRPGSQVVSTEELDRMLRTLPPGSIETFTQHVQPVLLNNCTASGCHAVQSETTFRLLRSASDKAASRRVTQRNIFAAMQWIDRDNPAASKLLTVPLGPHGQAKTAIFGDPQAIQYRRLAAWVDQVTRRSGNESAVPMTVQEAPPIPEATPRVHKRYSSARAQASRMQADGGQAGDAAELAFPSVADDKLGQAATDSQVAPANHRGPRRGVTAPAAPVAKGDPLDPEVFNRRFFGEQPAADAAPR
jgi:hypothetical protein